MKRSRFSGDQIVYAVRQAESGTLVGGLCRQLGMSNVESSKSSFGSVSLRASAHSLFTVKG